MLIVKMYTVNCIYNMLLTGAKGVVIDYKIAIENICKNGNTKFFLLYSFFIKLQMKTLLA